MTKQVKAHDQAINDYLSHKSAPNPASFMQHHLLWIGFLQQERLIHLIITFFFALLEITLVLLIAVFGVTAMWLSFIALVITVLLFFYIWHYYYLENTLQRWYSCTDLLQNYRHQTKG